MELSYKGRREIIALQKELSFFRLGYTQLKKEKSGISRSFLHERGRREHLEKQSRLLQLKCSQLLERNRELENSKDILYHNSQMELKENEINDLQNCTKQLKIELENTKKKLQMEATTNLLIKEELQELKSSTNRVSLGVQVDAEDIGIDSITDADDCAQEETKEENPQSSLKNQIPATPPLVPQYELEMFRSQVEKQDYKLNALQKAMQKQRLEYETLFRTHSNALLDIGSARGEIDLLRSTLNETQGKLDLKSNAHEETTIELGWTQKELEQVKLKLKQTTEDHMLCQDKLKSSQDEIDRIHTSMKESMETLVKSKAEIKGWKERCTKLEKWKADIMTQVDNWRKLLHKLQVTQPEKRERQLQERIDEMEQENQNIRSKLSKATTIIRKQAEEAVLLEKRIDLQKQQALAFVEEEQTSI